MNLDIAKPPKMLYRHASQILTKAVDKIVIVTGARQTGKTFLCLKETNPDTVLNFELAEDRKKFRSYQLSPSGPPSGTLFVDEIHKLTKWRNLLKGYYDKFKGTRYVVSGSSAFELMRGERGDSLAGRTSTIRLEPLTFREYLLSFLSADSIPPAIDLSKDIIKQIVDNKTKTERIPDLEKYWLNFYEIGGFPELLSKGDPKLVEPWLREYMSALLSRDIKNLESAKDAERVEQTFLLLLASIGSTYSLRNIGQTLYTSPNTIKSDLLILKKVLWGYELETFSGKISRKILKAKKFYPVDWIMTKYLNDPDKGQIFETAMVNLLHRHITHDTYFRIAPLKLSYFRDYNKEEIDIVVEDKKKSLCAIEIKFKAQTHDVTKLSRICERLKIPVGILLTNQDGIFELHKENILLLSASYFTSMLW